MSTKDYEEAELNFDGPRGEETPVAETWQEYAELARKRAWRFLARVAASPRHYESSAKQVDQMLQLVTITNYALTPPYPTVQSLPFDGRKYES